MHVVEDRDRFNQDEGIGDSVLKDAIDELKYK